MKEFLVAAWDDMYIYADKENKVPATCTLHLGLDGKWYELDLTEEHDAQLRALLQPWKDAGHRPQETLHREDAPRSPANRKHDPESVRHKRLLRDFADKYELVNPYTGKPSYLTDTGKIYYPKALKDAYTAYQAGAPEEEWRAIYETGLRMSPRRKKGPAT